MNKYYIGMIIGMVGVMVGSGIMIDIYYGLRDDMFSFASALFLIPGGINTIIFSYYYSLEEK